jgi:adenosylmethionine-8-amino-7-oxononanoate aminotransferase
LTLILPHQNKQNDGEFQHGSTYPGNKTTCGKC